MTLTPEQAGRLAPDLIGGAAAATNASTDAGTPLDLPIPERIGPYRVVGRIAAGGMGAVYEAEQERPRRTVAIKILRRSLSMPKALGRFRHEAEILAHLHHPAIAQVYDAGTFDDGGGAVPYFVMEHIPGATPITDYADERDLTLSQRLELFVQVCDAVHHGHQKGIIHRDLKPENILVDDHGHPRVIDFGVARATDSDVAITTMRTDVRELVGTLQYMSPEQCDGDPHQIDVRSDVYALGVVLYELMSRRLPYDLSGTSIASAARHIQHDQPPPPSAFNRRLRGDIDAIVQKAMDKDRHRRYGSAGDFQRDLLCHLAGDPIDARRPNIWTRTARWMLRHPIHALAAAAVVIGMATTLATWFATSWYVNHHPHSIWRSEDGRVVRLLSPGGMILEEWTSPHSGEFTLATMLERPQAVGGGRVVVIARRRGEDGRLPGALRVYRIEGSRAVLAWEGRVDEGDAPPESRAGPLSVDGFSAADASVVDVFPDYPGPEIVVVYHHSPKSAAVLCIYGLDGTVLYRMFHDGGLSALWVAEDGILVLAGQNGEAPWRDRGHPEVTAAHPWVVLAVRPACEPLRDEWTTAASGDPDVLWYRALLPPEATDLFGDHRLTPTVAGDPDKGLFRWTLFLADPLAPKAAVSCLFDHQGREIVESRIPTNEWDGFRGSPDFTLFGFGELPPIQADK